MGKVYILNALGDERCLNKKSEFISKCCHQNKLLLKNIKERIVWIKIKGCFILSCNNTFLFLF